MCMYTHAVCVSVSMLCSPGLAQNGTGASPVERNVLKVELADHSPNYYKPPLPYHGKVTRTSRLCHRNKQKLKCLVEQLVKANN